jgi:hypothetical protein
LISHDNLDESNTYHNSIEHAIKLILSGKKEFIYLEVIDPTNLYKLALASKPKDLTNPNYITLSKNGIIRHGSGEADQTSLKSFLKEYYVYHHIIKIPIFKLYWKW